MVNSLDNRSQPDDKIDATMTPTTAESLLSLVPGAMLIVDADGAIVALNSLAETLFGYTSGELVGAPVEKLMPEAARGGHAAHRAGFMDAAEMRPMGSCLEFSALHKDGKEIPVEISLSSLPGTDTPLTAAMVRDITERKTVELALQFSEERMLESAGIAHIGHFVWNIDDGRMLFCSEEYARIFGCSVDECLALQSTGSVSDVRAVPDESERLRHETYDQLLRNGEPIDTRYHITRLDGTIRHVRERTRPVADESGRVVSTVGTIQDITDEVEANRALADSNSLLARAADVAGLGHYVWDAASETLTFVSEQYARICGRSVEECLARHTTEAGDLADVHLDDREGYRRVMHTASDITAPVIDIVYRMVRPDGKIRHVHEREDPVFDETGQLVRYIGTLQDITDRIETEEALRRSEQRFAEAARMAGLGHYFWDDVSDRMITCSDEYAQILGRPVEQIVNDLADRDSDLQIVHPDDRERFLRDVYDADNEGGGLLDLEYRVLRPDGEIRHLHEIGETQFDATGKPVRTLGTVQDVTERKRAEALLREKDEHLEQAVEMARLGHYVWDEATDRLVDCSASYAAIHGMTVEEMLATAADFDGDLALLHPDDRDSYDANMYNSDNATPDMPRLEHEYRILWPDGEVRYLHEIAEIEFDDAGNRVRAVGTIQDVTERILGEQKIRDSEGWLSEAARMAGLGHYIWDEVAARLLYCSDEYARILGRPVEELLGAFANHAADLKFAHPDDRVRFLRNAYVAANDAEGHLDIEYRILRPDGEVRYVHEIGKTLVDDAGNPVRTLGTVQDITGRKQAEALLRVKDERLEQAIEIAGLGHYVWDEVTDRLLDCSTEYAAIHGLTVEEMIAAATDTEGDLVLLHPDDRGGYVANMYDGVTPKTPRMEHEYRILRPNGEVRYLHEVAEVEFDGAGNIVRTIGTVQDITERKQAEALLREKEEQLEQAVEMAHLGHYVWDEVADRFVSCSQEYAAIHGLTIEEELGVAPGDLTLVHPDDRDGYLANMNNVATPEAHRVEHQYRIVRPDGEVRHLHEIAEVIFDQMGRKVRSLGTIQDVTERVQAEQALRDNEAHLAEATRIAQLGHLVWNEVDETLIYCSEECARIYGLSVDKMMPGRIDDQWDFTTIYPDDLETYRKVAYTDYVANPEAVHHEYRIVRPGGEVRYIHLDMEPVFDAAGILVRSTCTMQDITERKRSEARLREKDEQLEQAVEMAHLGHFVWDEAADRLISCSPEYAAIHGLTMEEEFGDADGGLALIHPDDRDGYFVNTAMAEAPRIEDQYRIIRPDGEIRHLHEIAEVMFDYAGNPVRSHGTIQDVTERVEAEQAIRISEEKFRSVVENVPGAVFRQAPDEAGTFTFVSDGIRDLAGYEPSELVGEPMAFLTHPDDYDEVTKTALGHMDSGRPMNAEYRIRHKNGSTVWIREISRIVLGSDGEKMSFDGVLVDISERKAAEGALSQATDELRESEERYARAVAGANDAIWDWDIATGDCYLAPRYFQMLGYEPGEFAPRFDVLTEWLHPDDRPRVDETIRRHFDNDEPYDIEYRMRQKDGDYIWVRARGLVQRDGDGNPVRMAGSTGDITEFKLFEEQLRQSEIEFRGIFDGMPLSVWYEDWSEPKKIVDRLRAQGVRDLKAHLRSHPELVQELYEMTRVLRFNQATQEIYKADEETLWRDVDTFDFDEEREAYGDMLAAVADGSYRINYETRERDYEDDEIATRVNVNVPSEFQDDWSRVIVTSENVTAVKATEEQLRLSEIEFRGIFEGMPRSVWYEDWTEPKKIIDCLRAEGVTDFAAHFRANPELVQHLYEKSRTLRFNQTTLEIYNTDAETLWRDIDKFEFDEEREAYGDMLAKLADGTYRTTYETKEFNYEDGEVTIRINVHIPPEFHEDWARVVVTSEDVSGAKAIEEQLRQAQKLEAVGQLTGGVAHDFNNLLGVMLGNAELLADRLDDEKLLNFTNAIRRAAVRGAELTHGLLAFSRRQSLEPRRVDLGELVNGTTSILQRTLGAAIKIETSLADSDVLTDVDPNQIENALLNLTINARDAMPTGGVLHIETQLVDLDAEAASQINARPGRYAVLSVSDNGVGMSPEVLKRVYEPFFTTKDTGKGTGLGLSMVYGFVKQSEGCVTIDSTEGRGTVVRLYLPATALDDDAQTMPGNIETSPKGHGETVLLVEDDLEFRTISIGMLEDLGYRAVVAENAAAAFEMLTAQPVIDLVLTDVVLPDGKSGADVARAVQAQRPNVPVLFMSGYTAGHLDASRSEDNSDLPLIRKPFSRHALAHRLREVLAGEAAE